MKIKNRKIALTLIASSIAMPFSILLSSCGPSSEDFSIPLELPALKITTDDSQPITSKTEYKQAKIVLNNTEQSYCLNNVVAKVRGRGQASWAEMPKKSYRLNFEEKVSLFGSTNKYKKWNLISNYVDTSLLRNYVAYYLSSKLDTNMFSPSVHNVDLYVNNEYYGVYLLTDAVEVKEGRVDIDDSIVATGDNGYLIEQNKLDRLSEKTVDQDYFISNSTAFEIKSPDTTSQEYLEVKEAEINYIKTYLNNCFIALDGSDWSAVTSLIDPTSFANGYVLQELFANLDCPWCSMFYYKDKGNSPLKYGPIWDFDFSGGNNKWVGGDETKQAPDKFLWANSNIFFSKLLNFPEFNQMVIQKFSSFKSTFDQTMELLDVNKANGLYKKNQKSFERNFRKWKMSEIDVDNGLTKEVKAITTVDAQISFLKSWLEKRYAYLLTIYK